MKSIFYVSSQRKYFIHADGVLLSIGRHYPDSYYRNLLKVMQPFLPLQDPEKTCQKESFLFFNLPVDVIQKILKDYVPVSVKMDVLSKMEAFQPYLDVRSVWHQPSLNFYHLVCGSKPGWYFDQNKPWNRYYFSVDYGRLSFTLHSYYIDYSVKYFRKKPDVRFFYRAPVLLYHVQQSLKTLQNYNLTRVEKNNILVYRFYEDSIISPFSYPFSFFILVKEKTVYWGNNHRQFPLTKNECVIPEWDFNHKHDLILKLEGDGTVILECKTPCRDNFYIWLTPLLFKPCDDHPECACNWETDEFLHAVSTVTFSNFEEKTASITIKHFAEEFHLVNIFSEFRLQDLYYDFLPPIC